ncbi:spondin-1 isoform X2 [Microplitis mediator]|uniref:spondin-1 isoform X2 n=1 Tax=Microplitis mediator TaxID=375433 RepID=UPI00255767B9|nr:spondin-1 isoform X2 [Microplitis mediator]
MIYTVYLIVLILTGLEKSLGAKCDRKIDSKSEPGELEGQFSIFLWTFNKTDMVDQYMPNTRYIVTVEGAKRPDVGPHDSDKYREKFIRFLLTVDNKNESSSSEGSFDLIDDSLTQFSDKCPNSIMETSKIPKEDISVAWTSPPEGSGCVLFRATIMETPETWFMDEGGLVRTVCQDPKAIEDDPGPVLPECCACDEAKYEVTFEGLWSRNTHPKDFPSKGWMIKFSDVIGASHTFDYRFWKFDDTASEGLQQVAEFGSTRKLESELKEQSEHIRTIIKARGISHPNVTGRTFAVFRVDRKHHLMSLVSMIVPSPDWIVGVSGLELCLSNCSWIEHKELNLYPIDVGTDDGITYMSPDSPLEKPEPIRRITTSWPNDTRSPFYDPLGMDMKPMAKLHLSRQRLYEKACDDSTGTTATDSGGDNNDINSNNDNSRNSTTDEDGENHKGKNRKPHRKKDKSCRTTQWSGWGECSEPCGEGKRMRQRKYEDPIAAAAHNCNKSLSNRGVCYGNNPECNGRERGGTILDTPACKLNQWSEWSSCTTTCGQGETVRSRIFVHKKHRKHCMMVPNGPDLQQTVPCDNGPCENTETEEVRNLEDQDDNVVVDDVVEDTEAETETEEDKKEGDEENQENQEEENEENQEGENQDNQEGENEENQEGENVEETENDENDKEETNDEEEKDNDNDDDEDEVVEVTEEWLQKCPDDVYGPWGAWSPCTSSCGPGTKTRHRRPIDDSAEGSVNWNCRVQSVNCTSKIKSCEITPEDAEKICNEPLITGSCEGSFKRVYYNSTTNECKFFKYRGCEANRNNFQTVEECMKVCNEIRKGIWEGAKSEDVSKNYKVSISSVLSYHIPVHQERRKSKRERLDPESEDFNGIQAGSQVLSTTQEYEEGQKVDCEVTEWSDWTICEDCHGYTNSTRSIVTPAQNGGRRCPKKLMRKIKCHKILPGCSKDSRGDRRKRYRDRKSVLPETNNNNNYSYNNGVDCKLTHWSPWSPCHATCGNAVQHRTRRIKIHPYGLHGKPCTRLVEFRKCSMFPCKIE